jgi:hypothetical protein
MVDANELPFTHQTEERELLRIDWRQQFKNFSIVLLQPDVCLVSVHISKHCLFLCNLKTLAQLVSLWSSVCLT